MPHFKLALVVLALTFAVASLGCGSSPTCKSSSSSFSGCCSSHGGADSCGDGKYNFDGNKLMCEDGSTSPSCTG